MFRRMISLGLATVLLCSVARGAVILVTVASPITIDVGQTATLTVYGQVAGPSATPGNGVFAWDVDLRVGDPNVVSILAGTVDRSGWTGDGFTSSSGTVRSWGLDAIYDTGEGSDSLGLAGPVRLFSVEFRGLAPGETTLTIQPDATVGADFVTWKGDLGGDYSRASLTVTVVPEPATSALLALGAAVAVARPRGRSRR